MRENSNSNPINFINDIVDMKGNKRHGPSLFGLLMKRVALNVLLLWELSRTVKVIVNLLTIGSSSVISEEES